MKDLNFPANYLSTGMRSRGLGFLLPLFFLHSVAYYAQQLIGRLCFLAIVKIAFFDKQHNLITQCRHG